MPDASHATKDWDQYQQQLYHEVWTFGPISLPSFAQIQTVPKYQLADTFASHRSTDELMHVVEHKIENPCKNPLKLRMQITKPEGYNGSHKPGLRFDALSSGPMHLLVNPTARPVERVGTFAIL